MKTYVYIDFSEEEFQNFGFLGNMFAGASDFLTNAKYKAQQGLQKMGQGISNAASKVGQGIKTGVDNTVHAVTHPVQTAQNIGNGIAKGAGFVKQSATNMMNNMATKAGESIGGVKNFVGNMTQSFQQGQRNADIRNANNVMKSLENTLRVAPAQTTTPTNTPANQNGGNTAPANNAAPNTGGNNATPNTAAPTRRGRPRKTASNTQVKVGTSNNAGGNTAPTNTAAPAKPAGTP
jgi:hypothetical protein